MRLVLTWQGGTASRAELIEAGSRLLLAKAVRDGSIERVSQGRYALPAVCDARRVAGQLRGVMSHGSAAMAHGWEMLKEPTQVDITVPRGRRGPASARASRKRVRLHYRPVSDRERELFVTDPIRTVIDCARTLPFGEALAIADSALRHGAFELG